LESAGAGNRSPSELKGSAEELTAADRELFAADAAFGCNSGHYEFTFAAKTFIRWSFGTGAEQNLETPPKFFQHQTPVDEFFGIRVDVERESLPFQTLNLFEQICHVVDVPVAQLCNYPSGFRIQRIRSVPARSSFRLARALEAALPGRAPSSRRG
jgi:hypothetical protein